MQNSSTILAHRPTSNPLSTVFGRAGGCCLVSWGRRGPHRKHSGGRSHRHGAISDRKRSPRVKCRIYPLAPSGSTRCVSYDFWALLFPASSPPAPGLAAGIVFLRSRVCYALLSASPRGYALRFATVTVIGSGWLLSSNKILPMLGTLGQALSPANRFTASKGALIWGLCQNQDNTHRNRK